MNYTLAKPQDTVIYSTPVFSPRLRLGFVKIVCKAVIILAAVVLPATGFSGNVQGAITSSGNGLSAGKNIYIELCQSCHGVPRGSEHIAASGNLVHEQEHEQKKEHALGEDHDEEEATPPKIIMELAVIASDLTKDRLHASIRKPHPEGQQNWQLDPDEMNDLIAYVMEEFINPSMVKDLSIGRSVFSKTCSVCHGESGNASSWAQKSLNPPPFDFTSYQAKKLSKRHMVNTVTYGVDRTAMMGFAIQLSQEEIVAVVDFIRQEFIFPNLVVQDRIDDHSSHPGLDIEHDVVVDDIKTSSYMSLPFNGGLVGNHLNGQKLYDENCLACHGKEGMGDGPRAYFIFPRPQDLNSKRAQAELNRPHLYTGISAGIEGTVMPAWSKVLTEQEIADIAEYVYISFSGKSGTLKKN